MRSEQGLERIGRSGEEMGRVKMQPLGLRHHHLHLAGGDRRAAIAGAGDRRLYVSTWCAVGPALVESGGPEVIWTVDSRGLCWGPLIFGGFGGWPS